MDKLVFTQTLRYYYKLSRPWEYYGFSTLITALGLLLAKETNVLLILSVIIANFLACMFIFVINDIEDREYDALDEKKRLRNPVAGGVLSVKSANYFCVYLLILSLILYATLNLQVLFWGITLLILGFLYSWRKVQLKSKPVLDLISHGLYFGPLLLLTGFSVNSATIDINVLLMSISIFVLSIISDINNELRDYEVDRLSGINNTASIFNLARYKNYLSLITLLCVSYIFFYVLFSLPLLFNIFILIYSAFHSLYVLYLVKNKRIQIYEYNKRNVLYIGYAIIIVLYLLSL